MKKILVIDDELSKTDERKAFSGKYPCKGYEYIFAKDKAEGFAMLDRETDIALILLDIVFDNMSSRNHAKDYERLDAITREIWPSGQEMLSGSEYGLVMLDQIRAQWPEIPVVILSSKRIPDLLLWCWKHGACYYVMKPPESPELFERELLTFARYIQHDRIVGQSAAMRRVKALVALAAEHSSVSVLIMGESGTGKELVARAIHESGSRKDKPFVVVNCAAIPSALMESELFGHKKGSFTGATTERKGRLLEADGGTVFLDEIGEMPLDVQAKVLRAMNRGMSFTPLGSSVELSADVQIVAATNKDLEVETREGRFREDLLYRLNVFQIVVPPLRARRDDIPTLAEHFLNAFKAARYSSKSQVSGFDEECLTRMIAYSWPGNVRELENAVEHALLHTNGPLVDSAALPAKVGGHMESTGSIQIKLEPGFDIDVLCERIRWEAIKKAYHAEIGKGQTGLTGRIAAAIGLGKDKSNYLQRTILPKIRQTCPGLAQEIDALLPYRPRKEDDDSSDQTS